MLSIALVGLTRSLRGGRQDDSSDLSYSRNNPYPHETVVCLQPKLCPMPVVDWSPILLRRSALQSVYPDCKCFVALASGLNCKFSVLGISTSRNRLNCDNNGYIFHRSIAQSVRHDRSTVEKSQVRD